MFSITPLKESVLNGMAQLEEELWKLSEQANRNRNLDQAGKISSIIRELKKLAQETGNLFDKIEKVQTEPKTNSANRAVRIICTPDGEKPISIIIGEKEKPIEKWYEIPVEVANWIIDEGKELREIQNFISPSNEGFTKSAALKQLTNGWFIEIGDNKERLIKKAEKLLRNVDYAAEIHVETQDGLRTIGVSDKPSDYKVSKLMKLYRSASPETKNKIKEILGINF